MPRQEGKFKLRCSIETQHKLIVTNQAELSKGLHEHALSFAKDYRMDYEINKIKMEDEFKVCPSCGYRDGFHSMFKKEAGVTKWLFICPSCHEVFNIGSTV
jgi:transposase-like protein